MEKVKICGNTTLKDAQKGVQFGADALGFVFYEDSKRYVTPEQASGITKNLPPFVSCIGVFVNAKKEKVKQIAKKCRLDGLQFHGNESFQYCRTFLPQYKVVKAIKVKDRSSLKEISRYKDMDAVLLDTYKRELVGGTGEKFNWDLAVEAKGDYSIPIILAGGLNPYNVIEAIEKVKPYAVDVANGVEEKPGKKDYKLLEEFIRKAKTCNRF